MLVLTINPHRGFQINVPKFTDECVIHVQNLDNSHPVRIGITAKKDVMILRDELVNKE